MTHDIIAREGALYSKLIEQTAAQRERIGELEAALRAQVAVNVMYMKRDGFSAQDIRDCTSQAREALGDDAVGS